MLNTWEIHTWDVKKEGNGRGKPATYTRSVRTLFDIGDLTVPELIASLQTASDGLSDPRIEAQFYGDYTDWHIIGRRPLTVEELVEYNAYQERQAAQNRAAIEAQRVADERELARLKRDRPELFETKEESDED